MDSWRVFRRNRDNTQPMNHKEWSSFTWFPKTSLVWSLPIRQEILNASQIGIAFHGICPPFFIQTWLQQYGRRTFFYSAYCSLSNPICFRSVWCRRTMIPGKIFTSFAKFQGIVSVNDFRLPIWLQELLQTPLCFMRSFCFARIRLDLLGGQILHHDCISIIVSRFTTFTENFVICCNQITKIFCTRHDSANASSARGPCDFCPLTDLAISVFREMSFYTVFVQIRTSRKRRLQRWFMRRTGVWVSVFRNSVIHKIFSELLQPFWYVGMARVSPFLIGVFVFIWFWVFGCAQSTAGLLIFQKSTDLSFLAFQHVYLTQLRDRDLSHTGLTVLV